MRVEKRIIVVACVFLVLCACTILAFYYAASDEEDWVSRTTPLPQEIKQDLCRKFALPEKDALCDPKELMYAPEFFPAIIDRFSDKSQDFQEIQNILGKYLVYLEEPEKVDGKQYFEAWYDFRGDGITALVFGFNGDHQTNVLKNISPFYWEPGSFKAGEE